MDEVDALVSFYESWKQIGIGEDGLPLYEPVVMCRKAKPPLTDFSDPATEDEKEFFADAWKLFMRTRKVRDIAVQGYPLALWPVVGPTDLQNLVARDIVTVEQLAELDGKKGSNLPAPMMELAARAKKLLAMQGKVGKFEAIIHELTAQRDMLVAELKEAHATISAQNTIIGQVRMVPQQAA